MEMVLFK